MSSDIDAMMQRQELESARADVARLTADLARASQERDENAANVQALRADLACERERADHECEEGTTAREDYMSTCDERDAAIKERDAARAEGDKMRAEVARLADERGRLHEIIQSARSLIDPEAHPDWERVAEGELQTCEQRHEARRAVYEAARVMVTAGERAWFPDPPPEFVALVNAVCACDAVLSREGTGGEDAE